MTAVPNLVLLVEDHLPLAATVGEFLELHGMTVDYAYNAQSAKQLLHDHSYHCVVLDINLPDGTGYEVCRYIRQSLWLGLPIIMLTARDTLDEKLEGFDCGADDYLVKPFELKELVARIKAQTKRAKGLVAQGTFTVGDLVLEVHKNSVTRANIKLDLAPIQFKLLTYLYFIK